MKQLILLSILGLITSGCSRNEPSFEDYLRLTHTYYFVREVPKEIRQKGAVSIGLRYSDGKIQPAGTAYNQDEDPTIEIYFFRDSMEYAWIFGDSAGRVPIPRLQEESWATISEGPRSSGFSDYLLRLSQKTSISGGELPGELEVDIILYDSEQ
jgi:hypothetical protein